MLLTPALNTLIADLAKEFQDQLRYIPTAPVEKQIAYEDAIKDSIIGVARALYRNISGLDVDAFYKQAGYPGTNPIH